MRVKFLFIFLVMLLLGIWTVLIIETIDNRGLLFYLGEGMILLTLLYLFYFYRKVIKPMQTIGDGMDLLREQDFSSRLKPVGQLEADRIVDIFNRMMQQLKDERLRLREQNYFLDLLIAESPMGVIILSLDGDISMTNEAALRFLDYSDKADLQGKRLKELTTPLAEEIARIPKEATVTVRLSDAMIYRCSHLSFVDRGFSHPFILIESLTSEVVKAEKKAYEQVIRMIAHEVNNTTAGITSALDTVSAALESWEETKDLREVMRVCVERCYGMSHFITNFANVVKIPEPILQPVSLNERVVAGKMFMENVCRDREINLHLELCTENPTVKMDVVLFEQVLVNIIKNAAESIGKRGDIYIRTFDNPTMLEIADTGVGISKEVETKLFTPFFSTKPNGQGIGLLFIREVLIKHGCAFSLRSYLDGLTRFRIRF